MKNYKKRIMLVIISTSPHKITAQISRINRRIRWRGCQIIIRIWVRVVQRGMSHKQYFTVVMRQMIQIYIRCKPTPMTSQNNLPSTLQHLLTITQLFLQLSSNNPRLKNKEHLKMQSKQQITAAWETSVEKRIKILPKTSDLRVFIAIHIENLIAPIQKKIWYASLLQLIFKITALKLDGL